MGSARKKAIFRTCSCFGLRWSESEMVALSRAAGHRHPQGSDSRLRHSEQTSLRTGASTSLGTAASIVKPEPPPPLSPPSRSSVIVLRCELPQEAAHFVANVSTELPYIVCACPSIHCGASLSETLGALRDVFGDGSAAVSKLRQICPTGSSNASSPLPVVLFSILDDELLDLLHRKLAALGELTLLLLLLLDESLRRPGCVSLARSLGK